jgi:hypothetical protein
MNTQYNTFKVIVGDIIKIQGDVVLNWTTSTLNMGPLSFFKIHRAAGAQLSEITLPYKENVRSGDTFSTIGCLLPYYAIIHCIKPDIFSHWGILARNLIATLSTYKENNLARNLYIPLPEKEFISEFISQLLIYEEYIKNIEFIFVCEFDWERDMVTNILQSQNKFCKTSSNKRIANTIDNFFLNLVSRIFPKFSSTLFLGKLKSSGHNKKELQKNIKRT